MYVHVHVLYTTVDLIKYGTHTEMIWYGSPYLSAMQFNFGIYLQLNIGRYHTKNQKRKEGRCRIQCWSTQT